MAAIQLAFNLRTSPNVKTVHLLGSWDNYAGQLPLSKDSAKNGGWKGTFRFQGQTLKQGQRYWYYYIIDGYYVSHDPAQSSTKEATTGRMLNILDVPTGATPAAAPTAKRPKSIAKGRPLSISKIAHPRPIYPNKTAHLYETADESADFNTLTSRFSAATLDDEEDSDADSDCSVPSTANSSLSSRSGSSLSSASSNGSNCSCERYGITRRGDRVKLDCGGSRCGGSDDECCTSDEEEFVARSSRRQGVVIAS
ncbi:MAG: hypothetical protein M1824_000917 [Vezdaea acicularis]|nr:MAG: hypothetical protein M1824_000917 [Vezdaea acicularis]